LFERLTYQSAISFESFRIRKILKKCARVFSVPINFAVKKRKLDFWQFQFTNLGLDFGRCQFYICNNNKSTIPTMNVPVSNFQEKQDISALMHLYSNDVDDNTIEFWKRATLNHCLYNKSLLFTLKGLTDNYTIYGLVPSSFFLCKESLVNQGHIREVSHIMDYNLYPTSYERTISLFSNVFTLIPTFLFQESVETKIYCNCLLECMQSEISHYCSRQSHSLLIFFLEEQTFSQETTLKIFFSKIADQINNPLYADIIRNLNYFDTKFLLRYMHM
jgi:hypothetical protein